MAAGSPLLAASGGIFRDYQANHIGSFCVFLGEGSPVLVEFMAAVVAIEKSKAMNWTKLWPDTDCSLVVKAFSDATMTPWKIKTRWLQSWNYTISIDFRITHIFRETNFCADLLLVNIDLKSNIFSWFHLCNDILLDYLLDKAETPKFKLCSREVLA